MSYPQEIDECKVKVISDVYMNSQQCNCLHSFGIKGTLKPHSTPLNNEPVPQVLKLAVNLSCLIWSRLVKYLWNSWHYRYQSVFLSDWVKNFRGMLKNNKKSESKWLKIFAFLNVTLNFHHIYFFVLLWQIFWRKNFLRFLSSCFMALFAFVKTLT